MAECYFSTLYKCRCPKSANLSSNGLSRIQTIIECSKIYEDGLHQELEQLLAEDSNCTFTSHRTCVACYTSPKSMKRILKRKSDISSEKLEDYKEEKKRVHCSSTIIFAYFVANGATYKKTVSTQGTGERLSCVERK